MWIIYAIAPVTAAKRMIPPISTSTDAPFLIKLYKAKKPANKISPNSDITMSIVMNLIKIRIGLGRLSMTFGENKNLINAPTISANASNKISPMAYPPDKIWC